MNNPKEFFKDSPNANIIEGIYFTQNDVKEAINELSQNAAAGPDRIPAILLKKCRDQIAQPLETIFRESLVTGEIP